MIELAGTEDKLEAFIELIHPFGIIELARTGLIAMPRGGGQVTPANISTVRRSKKSASGPKEAIDPGSLPPG